MGVGFVDISPNGSWIYQDDLTWLHGKHTFRFGYEYKRYFYNGKSLSDAGAFTFSARQTDYPGQLNSTGNSFASFLLGAYTGRTTVSRDTRRGSGSLNTACMSWMTGRSRPG